MKLKNSIILMCALLSTAVFLNSCGDDDGPEEENVEEIITDVTLTFTPEGGGTAITATAVDPDGEGAQELAVSGPVNLSANTTYTLTLDLQNSLEMESISDEVREEADEHMFFFAWTDGAFSDPAGNGNADNRADAVNYEDMDGGNLPLGLTTSWTTGDASNGTFRVVLKHQPDIKSATSTVNDGESDIDITWTLNVQ